MKRTVLSLMLVLLLPILSFGQSDTLLKSYEIPTYEYHSFELNSPDLFGYDVSDTGSTKTTTVHSALIFNESLVKQKPKDIQKSAGMMIFDYFNKSRDTDGVAEDDSTQTTLVGLVTGTRQKYLNSERGLFFHIGFTGLYLWDFTNKFNTHIFLVPLGMGYGRVVGVRNVVQAYIISDELDANLSDADLHALAELIEKYENGYFYGEYRDNADIEFYDQIAAITGKPGQAMKVRQITTSPVYKTSARYSGWQVKLGITNFIAEVKAWSIYSAAAYGYEAAVTATVEYGLPLGFDKQVSLVADYILPLTDEFESTMGFSATLTHDHNYTWASKLDFSFRQMMPEVGDNLSNFGISLTTDYSIMNKMSIFASVSHNKSKFADFSEFTGVGTTQIWFPIAQRLPETIKENNIHLGLRWYLL